MSPDWGMPPRPFSLYVYTAWYVGSLSTNAPKHYEVFVTSFFLPVTVYIRDLSLLVGTHLFVSLF